MERMLINATDPQELRVALVRNDYLYDYDVEQAGYSKKKGNIYKGRITRKEPSLEAAFVEYGSSRQGFLPFKEIAPEYYQSKQSSAEGQINIKDAIYEGQELIIQIDKEERGTKGAALTTFLTLAGCYLVLMPNSPRAGGISRRVEGEDRDELKNILNNLNIPEGMGVITRTAAVGKNLSDLQWDLDVLVNQYRAIQHASFDQRAPFLIHQEGDVIIRSIRDNLRKDINEIIIDSPNCFVKARNYIEQVKPDFLNQVKLYQDSIPLFNRYQIENQIETAYLREVALPSGGSIIIDRTEALVSIDINSAKATGGEDIESTALNTNLEAAAEIARQLRLRDLGGLIVIDFIDMGSIRNQREVENSLREALKSDRARIQVGRISRFGLLEMSRQRLRLSLGEATQEICKQCDGRGTIRSIGSLALSLVRLIEEEALKNRVREVRAQLPIQIATYIINEKRTALLEIEKRHGVNVLIIPNPYLTIPHYKISNVQGDETYSKPSASYNLVENPDLELPPVDSKKLAEQQQPAVPQISTTIRPHPEEIGLLKRLWSSLFGPSEEELELKTETKLIPEKKEERPRSQREERRPDQRPGSRRHDRRRPSRGNRSMSSRRHHHQRPQGGGHHHHSQNSQTEKSAEVQETHEDV